MYTDDEIEQFINEEIAQTEAASYSDGPEIIGEPPTPELIEEFGFFNVSCRHHCGTFTLEETEVLGIDLSQGRATFRCRLCNDIQTTELLILD
jgi:hypothetical protein